MFQFYSDFRSESIHRLHHFSVMISKMIQSIERSIKRVALSNSVLIKHFSKQHVIIYTLLLYLFYSLWLNSLGVDPITSYRNGTFLDYIFDEFWEIHKSRKILKYSLFYRVIWEEKVGTVNSTEFRRISNNLTEVPLTDSTDQSASVVNSRENFLIIYTGIMVLGTIFYLARSFSFFRMCLKISINLHDMIFRGITRAKMIFFNNNPSGRILNRFARDINNVDSLLPNIMVDVLDVSGIFT